MGLIKIVKSNWKKCTLFSIALSYGLLTIKTQYDIQKHMRNVCNETSSFARSLDEKLPRNILVIINPRANYYKAATHFQKFCEPILHLAGFNVECMKTSYVGHAKSYLESSDKIPDAVIVAGGDGTASEVVTGLMRNSKSSCPVVILPMGSKNKMPVIFGRAEYVKCLTSSVLCILKGSLQSENLIKYELIDPSTGNLNQNKPIYGLNSFHWGILRDLDSIKNKYWYFGYFKGHAAVLLNAFSDKLSWKCTANLIYTSPCSGCSNCIESINITNSKFKWLNLLHKNTNNKLQNLRSLKSNDCKKFDCCNVESSQISIKPHYNSENVAELVLKICSSFRPGIRFVQKSFSDMYCIENESTSRISSRTIEIIPTKPCQNKYYSIDGEDYEVRPIKITLIPKAIHVFK